MGKKKKEKRKKQTLSVVCSLRREQFSSLGSSTNLHFTTNKNKRSTCSTGAHTSMSKDAAKMGNTVKLEGSRYHSLGPRLCPQGKKWELPTRKHGEKGRGRMSEDRYIKLFSSTRILFFTEGKKMWECRSMKKWKRVNQRENKRVRMREAGTGQQGGGWSSGEALGRVNAD